MGYSKQLGGLRSLTSFAFIFPKVTIFLCCGLYHSLVGSNSFPFAKLFTSQVALQYPKLAAWTAKPSQVPGSDELEVDALEVGAGRLLHLRPGLNCYRFHACSTAPHRCRHFVGILGYVLCPRFLMFFRQLCARIKLNSGLFVRLQTWLLAPRAVCRKSKPDVCRSGHGFRKGLYLSHPTSYKSS